MQAAIQWCRSTFEALRIPSALPQRALKRQTDLILAITLLILTAPLIAIAAVLIRMSSPGPVIFRQTRVGRDGREFEIIKLRSMIAEAEKRTGPVWAARNDPRVTTVGKILRKYRIDELPQLVNVLSCATKAGRSRISSYGLVCCPGSPAWHRSRRATADRGPIRKRNSSTTWNTCAAPARPSTC